MRIPYSGELHITAARWARKLALLPAIGLFGLATAQTVDTYTFTTGTGATLADMSGATTLVASGSSSSAVTAIGFPFDYEGTAFSDFSANQAGNIRLGTNPVDMFQIQNLGPGNEPAILAWSGEPNLSLSTVQTMLTGSAPNRTRIVQWNLKLQWAAATCTFQALLHEGSNAIEFRYGNGGVEPWKHYVAIGGSNAANYLNVQASHTASNSNNVSTDFWPGAGRSYSFAPPVIACSTPVPGNTISSVASACPGATATLSLQHDVAGPGISFQWERSDDGGTTWSPISGATSATHTSANLFSSASFRCAVTCSLGPVTAHSTPVLVDISAPAPTYMLYSGTLFMEDFAGWADRCSTVDVPDGPAYWANTPAYGAGTWRSSTATALQSGWDNTGGGSGVTTSTTVDAHPSALPVSAPAARFHSRQAGAPTQGSLDLHMDMSAATGGERLRFEYINQFGSGTLAVLVSTDGGSSFTQLGSTLANTAASWVMQEFTIGSTSATTVIRLRGTTSGSGNDIGVDNLRIIPASSCTMPTALTATVSGPGQVDLSWDCSTCTGSYIVEYGNVGFTPGTGATAGGGTVVTASGSPTTISGIPVGNKRLYVRQNCGGSFSENSAPVNFSIVAGDFCANAIDLATLSFADWGQVATTSGALNNYNSSACLGSTPGPDVVLYHDVAPGATLQLGLWSNSNSFNVAYGDECPGNNVLACANTGGYFPMGGNVQPTGEWGDPAFVWTNTGCDTERLYIQVDGFSTGGGINAFNYSYTPAEGTFCAAVTGIAVNTANSGTGAEVSWDATCSGNVSVEYGPSGFTPGSGTVVAASGTSTTLAGLDLDVAYDLYIRQDCGEDGLSTHGSATTFTLHNGDDCSRVITLNGESGSITLNTTGTNNDISACVAGNNGGDLIISHVVQPGHGIYITSAPQGAYTGQVAIGYGESCPGSTELYCAAGAADHLWLNETGSAQTVYLVQDGTDEGETIIEWTLFEECALYDSDEDGINDCDDLCPELAGTVGDVCTVGGSEGIISEDCQCVVVGCNGTKLVVNIMTDDAPEETTWTLLDATANELASGGPYTEANSLVSTEVCISSGTEAPFRFNIHDSFGNGLTNGYWEILDEAGNVVLRDRFDGANGSVSPSSTPASGSYGQGHAISLPLGTATIQSAYCGVYTNIRSSKVYCEEVPGATNYQFEFSDPDAGFFRRIAVPRNWVRFSEMVTLPLSNGVIYFTRVRADQGITGFNDDRFGPGCELALTAQTGCTALIDTPGSSFSCGVTRTFGGSAKLWAIPVSGASQYRFRFAHAETEFVRTIVSSNYVCALNWVTAPLQNGLTYAVTVETNINGVWSGYCGPTCQVTIGTGAVSLATDGAGTMDISNVELWPNPNAGDRVNLRVAGIDTKHNTVSIDVIDLFGKQVDSRVIAVNEGMVNTVLSFHGNLADGVYFVRLTIGDESTTKRLVVQR